MTEDTPSQAEPAGAPSAVEPADSSPAAPSPGRTDGQTRHPVTGLSQRELAKVLQAAQPFRAHAEQIERLREVMAIANAPTIRALSQIASAQNLFPGGVLDARLAEVIKQQSEGVLSQVAQIVKVADLYPDGVVSKQLAELMRGATTVSDGVFTKQLVETARIAANFSSVVAPVVRQDVLRAVTASIVPEWPRGIAALSLLPDLRTSVLATVTVTDNAARAFARLNAGRTPRSDVLGTRYRTYVSNLPQEPDASQQMLVQAAGTGMSGMAVTDLAAQTDPDLLTDAEPAGIFQRFGRDVVGPWMTGPSGLREALVDCLYAIDTALPELLFGAWHTIENRPPAALATIANHGIELLDRALRAATPTEPLMAWIRLQERQQGLVHEGRPTRSARVRYLLRDCEGDQKLVLAQVDAIVSVTTALTGRLQGTKHASAADVTAVSSYILTLEALLVAIFAGGGP